MKKAASFALFLLILVSTSFVSAQDPGPPICTGEYIGEFDAESNFDPCADYSSRMQYCYGYADEVINNARHFFNCEWSAEQQNCTRTEEECDRSYCGNGNIDISWDIREECDGANITDDCLSGQCDENCKCVTTSDECLGTYVPSCWCDFWYCPIVLPPEDDPMYDTLKERCDRWEIQHWEDCPHNEHGEYICRSAYTDHYSDPSKKVRCTYYESYFTCTDSKEECLPPPLCGNRILDEGEECEADGDCGSGEKCDECECVLSECGDGVIDEGEKCDDGKHCDNGKKCMEDLECSGIGDEECKTMGEDGCDNICKTEKSYLFAKRGIINKRTIHMDEEPLNINKQLFFYFNKGDKLGCLAFIKKAFQSEVRDITILTEDDNIIAKRINTENAMQCNNNICKYVFREDDFRRINEFPKNKKLKCDIKLGETILRSQPARIISNEKNQKMYRNKPAFILSNEQWQSVLQAVPAITWYNDNEEWCNKIPNFNGTTNTEKCAYPLLVFHKEGHNYDIDSTVWFLKQYDPDSLLYIQNNLRTDDVNTERNIMTRIAQNVGIDSIKLKGILWWQDMWKEKGLIIVVGNDTYMGGYNGGILGAILASHLNAPLVFVDEKKRGEWEAFLKNKTIITVGVENNIVTELKGKNIIVGYNEYEKILYAPSNKIDTFDTPENLQKFLFHIIDSGNIMFVNPKDIGLEYCESKLRIKGKPNFKKWYCEMSMAAAYWAAAHNWNIGFVESTNATGMFIFEDFDYAIREDKIETIATLSVKPQIKEIMNFLFVDKKPSSVLFLAAPKAIPLSIKTGKGIDISGNNRFSYDKFYVNENDETEIKTKIDVSNGRAYTKTISGIFSYANRVIFNIRSDNNRILFLASYTAFKFLGVKFLSDANKQQQVFRVLKINLDKAGYDVDCRYGYGPSKPPCKIGLPKIPFKEYKDKLILYYDGHGCSDAWVGFNHAKDFPFMKSPLIFSSSCLTNDYYHSYTGYTLGSELLEKGAIAHVGAVGAIMKKGGISMFSTRMDDFFRSVIFPKNYDIGTAVKKVYDYGTPKYGGYPPDSSDIIVMGDPSIRLTTPKVSYPYILQIYYPPVANPGKGLITAYFYDISGTQNIGKAELIIKNAKTENKISELDMVCKEDVFLGFNVKKCEAELAKMNLQIDSYIFEIKVYDKQNRFYHSWHDSFIIGYIKVEKFRCTSILGKENKEIILVGELQECDIEITTNNAELDKINITEVNGHAIEVKPQDGLNCRKDRRERNKYGCKVKITPKEPGDHQFKVSAMTKPIQGKVYDDEKIVKKRVTAIKISKFTCQPVPAINMETECNLLFETKPVKKFIPPPSDVFWELKELQNKEYIFTEPVPKYTTYGIFYRLTWKLKPQESGEYKFKAKLKRTVNNIQFEDEAETILVIKPIHIKEFLCPPRVLPGIESYTEGKKSSCKVSIIVKKEQFKGAILVENQKKITPSVINLNPKDCKYLDVKNEYECFFRFKPVKYGRIQIHVTANAMEDSNGGPYSDEDLVSTYIARLITIRDFECRLNGINKEGECKARIFLEAGTFDGAKLSEEYMGMSIPKPSGDCSFPDTLSKKYAVCKFKIIPNVPGKYKFLIVAKGSLDGNEYFAKALEKGEIGN